METLLDEICLINKKEESGGIFVEDRTTNPKRRLCKEFIYGGVVIEAKVEGLVVERR